MHPDFATCDPLRAPDWRLERALELLDAQDRPRRPTRWDDESVRKYLKFLCDYRATLQWAEAEVAGTSRDPYDRPILAELFGDRPHLWYAHRVHFDVDPEWRTIIQARLLAGESDKQIARRLGTIPDAIEWYERIFFDVRDRLDCRDWIVKTILGPAAMRGPSPDGVPTEAQRAAVLKLIGYFGRSQALDAELAGFMPVTAPASAEETERWFAQVYQGMLQVKATAALQTLQPNHYQVMQLLALAGKSAAVAESAAGDRTDLELAIEQTIQSIPWELGLRREGKRTALKQECASSPYEPRAAEELMIGAGIEPPELMKLVRGGPRAWGPEPPSVS